MECRDHLTGSIKLPPKPRRENIIECAAALHDLVVIVELEPGRHIEVIGQVIFYIQLEIGSDPAPFR